MSDLEIASLERRVLSGDRAALAHLYAARDRVREVGGSARVLFKFVLHRRGETIVDQVEIDGISARVHVLSHAGAPRTVWLLAEPYRPLPALAPEPAPAKIDLATRVREAFERVDGWEYAHSETRNVVLEIGVDLVRAERRRIADYLSREAEDYRDDGTADALRAQAQLIREGRHE